MIDYGFLDTTDWIRVWGKKNNSDYTEYEYMYRISWLNDQEEEPFGDWHRKSARKEITEWCESQFGPSHTNNVWQANHYTPRSYFLFSQPSHAMLFRLRWHK
jgi:hypothetical protein